MVRGAALLVVVGSEFNRRAQRLQQFVVRVLPRGGGRRHAGRLDHGTKAQCSVTVPSCNSQETTKVMFSSYPVNSVNAKKNVTSNVSTNKWNTK